MFGHESRRDFEAPDEEQVRFQQRQEYAAQKIGEMMREEEEAEKNQQDASRGGDAGARGGQEAASGADADEAESPRQGDAACPDWPRISDKKMKEHRRKLTEQRLGEYIFLYCCHEQCIDCCLRCLREFDIDPKHCKSTGCDGIAWAAKKQGGVSAEFREFWEGLTSETV